MHDTLDQTLQMALWCCFDALIYNGTQLDSLPDIIRICIIPVVQTGKRFTESLSVDRDLPGAIRVEKHFSSARFPCSCTIQGNCYAQTAKAH